MRLSMFCICGSSIYLSGTNFDAVYKATEVWRNFHTGEGHRTCDRKTCLAARRKSERSDKYLKEEGNPNGN